MNIYADVTDEGLQPFYTYTLEESEAMQKTTSKAPRMKMKRMNDARQIRRAVWKYARHEIVRLIRFTVLGICYFLLIALLLIDRISQLGLL